LGKKAKTTPPAQLKGAPDMSINQFTPTSYLARYIFLNAVDITDYQVFPSREIQNAGPTFHFPPVRSDATLEDSLTTAFKRSPDETLDQFLARNGTVAFLVIHHGQLLFEHYYNGYKRDSICTSFSTVKSFVSALVGIAVHEKLIGSLDDPVTKYIPKACAPFWQAISLRHLVSMSSGLKYREGGFLPWDDEPRIYYSPDLRRLVLSARKDKAPGTCFRYNNYNLILLGMVLERATSSSVSAYLQEKIWKPLGMEFPASWSLDSLESGMEKMESGLNARAVDFAKFGQLYLQRGMWEGKQIIPESWGVESTTIASDATWKHYKYLWWMARSGQGRYMAAGNLGQFIFIAPDKDCVILRFGRGKPANWRMIYPQLFGVLVDSL
jgi:CubicO group peptidase (beta-lactamase class C family)